MANTGLGKMHLDLYTQNSALTQKAKFWCNYVGALKDIYNRKKRIEYGMFLGKGDNLMEEWIPPTFDHGPSIWSQFRPVDITLYDLLYETKRTGSQDLRAPDDRVVRHIHPSIVETLPEDFPDLKHEFSKLESQMFDRPKRPGLVPLTRVLPDAHDRIFTPGYRYDPVHTEIYGTYRSNAKRLN